MPFSKGKKLRKQPFKFLERMSKHNVSPEEQSGSHTKTFSTLKGLTKTGIKLQKHAKHSKKLDIKVQHTPPDAKLLAKYEHQLIDVAPTSIQCTESDFVDSAIKKPGKTCRDDFRETNTKGKIRPVPTPRKIVSVPSSSSSIEIREPEENLESERKCAESKEESDYQTTPTVPAVPQRPTTFVPNHMHMTKSMSLPRPRKLPLSPCPSRPPPISFKLNPSSEPTSVAESSDSSTRLRSQTLPRLSPKFLPPDFPPNNVDHAKKLSSAFSVSSSKDSSTFLTPATAVKPRISTLKPQQPSWTCLDAGSPQKKNECFVPGAGRLTLTLGDSDSERSRKSPTPSPVSKRKRNDTRRAALKREADPNNLKPQPFKVGYLYKRDGNDYKTKRHFRLSKEGGLKLYKNEQDKVTASIEEICLDFMRCELQLGVSDVVNKDPRYFFCLKSDDLSGKSWFLASESEYERKKWMISIAWHIENECKPPVTDINHQTKEYLGYSLSDNERDDLDTSSSNCDYDSDSDDVYQARIERSPRITPQIAEPDDEIYGEFDPNLTIQNGVMESTMAMSGMTLSLEPRRGSIDRKASTTHNIFPDLDTRLAVTPIITEEEEDDTYMTAADVGSSLPAQMSVSRGMVVLPSQVGEGDDDTYMDGFSLRASSSTSMEVPILPVSRPPLFAPPESTVYPSYESSSTTADTNKRHSVSGSSLFYQSQQLGEKVPKEEENLYMDQEELFSTAEDDDIYAAPPLLGVDVQQPLQSSAPPIPQRVPAPPRNLPPAPRRPSLK